MITNKILTSYMELNEILTRVPIDYKKKNETKLMRYTTY